MNDAYDSNSDRRNWWQLARIRAGAEIDRRNYYVFIAWLTAWGLCFLVTTWVLQEHLEPATPVAWMLAIVPTAFAITALFAYLRFLRMADGLLRQVQLEGIALGFGAGVFLAAGYRLLEYAGAPTMQVSHIITIMMFGWAAGQLVGMRRYLHR